MIIFGVRKSDLGIVASKNCACPKCGNYGSVNYSAEGKYFHVFWIPTFPVGKKGYMTWKQIKEIEKRLKLLQSLKNHNTTTRVSLGSVIKTDHLNYYIAISCPTLTIDQEKYYCISALSPIGKLLLGKKVNETIQFL